MAGNTNLFMPRIMLSDEHWLKLGEVNDCTVAPELLEQLPTAENAIADKSYDSQKVRDQITEKGSNPVIPRRKDSKVGNTGMD